MELNYSYNTCDLNQFYLQSKIFTMHHTEKVIELATITQNSFDISQNLTHWVSGCPAKLISSLYTSNFTHIPFTTLQRIYRERDNTQQTYYFSFGFIELEILFVVLLFLVVIARYCTVLFGFGYIWTKSNAYLQVPNYKYYVPQNTENYFL